MSRHILSKIALLSIAVHAPLQAQSLVSRPGDVDRRASIAITIPLSGQKSAETKPRMELLMSQDRARTNDYRYDFERLNRPRASRVGFTLDKQPQLMMNGRAVQPQDNKARMGTAGYIAIGVVVVAAVGALVIYQIADDASE